MRGKLGCIAVLMIMIFAMTGCGKKEEVVENTPVEEVLTPISANDLVPGRFYVKNGLNFYQLAGESCNFDYKQAPKSSNYNDEGVVSQDLNRLLSFTWRDNAIPTLYKNDQLIYVSNDTVPTFTWERYKDNGYSIGVSGLIVGDSGKISTAKATKIEQSASIYQALANTGMDMANPVFTIDAINGTTLNASYLSEAGTVSGMTMDIRANVDIYVGTTRYPISTAADTRYFKAFELFSTSRYELSTDGYAILEVPSYLKSGYYLLNNFGLVKYLNIERGQDESGIDLNDPYFFIVNGRTLTYYEYLESKGEEIPTEKKAETSKNSTDPEEYEDRVSFVIDNPQENLTVNIDYRYRDDNAREDAAREGKFPKAYLMDAEGNLHSFSQKKDTDAVDGKTHLIAEVAYPTPGNWHVLFENYEDIVKTVMLDINSGNSSTFIHSGTDKATKTIYFEGSNAPYDIVLTWERSDRKASEVRITSPTRVEYSAKETPGNIMADEPGRYVIKVPYVEAGEYTIEIAGDNLGRVWIQKNEAVGFDYPQSNGVAVESEAAEEEEVTEAETQAAK